MFDCPKTVRPFKAWHLTARPESLALPASRQSIRHRGFGPVEQPRTALTFEDAAGSRVRSTAPPVKLGEFTLEGSRIGSTSPPAKAIPRYVPRVLPRVMPNDRTASCGTCRLVKCSCGVLKPSLEDQPSDLRASTFDLSTLCEELQEASEMPLIAKKKRNDQVFFLKPRFTLSLPTVLMDYPPQCLLESRVDDRTYPLSPAELAATSLTFKVSKGAIKYNCVVNALVYSGFSQTSTTKYNVRLAGVPKPEQLKDMYPLQHVNHFPGIWQLGRKDYMWRNLASQKRKFPAEYDFCPQTFIMPDDHSRLLQAMEDEPAALWIRKPAGSCCGIGIQVLTATSKVSKKPGYVVSRYIANPHTINGFKYDLRVYVCVTSFDPLRVYLYEDGLVRFATQTYSKDKKKVGRRFMHLTNFSVNKHSAGFVKNKNPAADGQGSKWSLRALRQFFLKKKVDYARVFREIETIIIKTLIAAEPHVVNALNQGSKSRSLCFEVYGFDILLDSQLKPWLLEVNVSPSLSSSSPLDRRIKTSLMCDVFNLVGISPFDQDTLDQQRDRARVARLLGYTKTARSANRNLATLLNCGRLEEYELSEDDLKVLAEGEEEASRTGFFKTIFPVKEGLAAYSKLFPVTRYNNLLVQKYLETSPDLLKPYLNSSE